MRNRIELGHSVKNSIWFSTEKLTRDEVAEADVCPVNHGSVWIQVVNSTVYSIRITIWNAIFNFAGRKLEDGG